MTTYNEQEAMQGVAQRFVKAAEELRLSGAQLFRDGIVTNDQVLSKIKNGWQKPPKKAIELFCQKYAVSAAWLYTGEGNMFLGRVMPVVNNMETGDEKLLYNTDFNKCLDNKGVPISTAASTCVVFPSAGDIDFWCLNGDKSLAPLIMQGDTIALKRVNTWKEYIPGDLICVVVTNEFKVLRKVSVTQNDEQSITFIQMVDGRPVESRISKDIIIEIYQVVGHFRLD